MSELSQRYHRLAGSQDMLSGQFLANHQADAFKGEEEVGVLVLVEDAEIGNQFEDQISQGFRNLFDVVAVKNILASQLVAHVGHEFQNTVVPLQDGLELLKEYRKRQGLPGGTPEGEQMF